MFPSTDPQFRILIIDDESSVRNILCDLLSDEYHCTTADSAENALALLQTEKFSLVLSDINLGGMTGLEMIPQFLSSSPDTVVMVISGEKNIDNAIEAIRAGAFDYIQKPFDLQHIETAIKRALEHHSLLESKRLHENHLEELIKDRTAQLNYLSYHDALTGLPNRILLEDRLTQAIVSAGQNEQTLALFLLSLDRFREIRDILGHRSGYQLLQNVAERLISHLPAGTTVARFEGDEFSLMLPQIENAEGTLLIANRLIEALKLPFVIDNNELFITISVGISLYPDDGETAQTLLGNTAVALRRAKEAGGNNYQFYTAGLNTKALNRLTLESNLRKALERGEFEVFYQPKVDFDSGAIVGMEALARWRHPERGLVSPIEFIPLAEDTGLIIPMGEWILRMACLQSTELKNGGFPALRVSVNLSARQFQQENLSEMIVGAIQNTGIDPTCLELELTESSIMKNPVSAIKTLQILKEIGIKISIDDFGTGYSSLANLKRLPIDVLKIDKSFVQEVAVNPDDAALVMTIITLAHNLRLKVVAEGVETEEQLNLLHLLRCDEWQGYFCSQPLCFEDFKGFLQKKLTVSGLRI